MQNSDSNQVCCLKRKRTTSNESTTKENEPMMDEKRHCEEAKDDGHRPINIEERIPLSEIPLETVICKDRSSFHGQRDSESSTEALEECHIEDESETICSLGSVFGDETDEETSSLLCSSYRKAECFDWAKAADIWELYMEKEECETTHRTSLLFYRHPSITPRMRSVLLDWVVEVCDVYKLHRETYYLSVDYLDRYLSATENIAKSDLQLLGVTCLFIASKYEEIYPPKLSEFAYITDGACTDDDIVAMELKIAIILDWKFNVITSANWLSVLIQLMFSKKEKDLECITPNFDQDLYCRVIQLLDFSTLDEGFLRYSYRCLAITALYLACSKDLSILISGVDFEYITDCVQWMTPLWDVLREKFSYKTSDFTLETLPTRTKTEEPDFSHTRIKRFFSIELLEAAHTIAAVTATNENIDISLPLLTPPESAKKT